LFVPNLAVEIVKGIPSSHQFSSVIPSSHSPIYSSGYKYPLLKLAHMGHMGHIDGISRIFFMYRFLVTLYGK
ncbi:MAG: hypothetical protein Q7V05_00945, partial [Methanoregula sp.]|nr:hypothetical protein [Methanoregula sp.]